MQGGQTRGASKVTIDTLDLMQLLSAAPRSRSLERMRLDFAKIMAKILGAQAVQLMGLDITRTRCVPLGSWPHATATVAEFDLQGKSEAERLMLFALKIKRFQRQNKDSDTGNVLLDTLKAAIFGADSTADLALIAPETTEVTDKAQAGEQVAPLIFFALLGEENPDDAHIKLARLYASYCHDLNQMLLDLTIRAGATENLAQSLKQAEKERKNMRDAMSEMMSQRLVGSSALMSQLRRNIARFAPSDAPIFIHGETGTGKELAAREIHLLSRRRDRAFVAINVTALPKGLEESELFGFVKGAFTGADSNRKGTFAEADGGTLFFDEIGDMSLDLQAKILRVLQEKSFRPLGANREIQSDFRLISATHRNLEDMVAKGQFREDLFYRLTTFSLEMPPLRARREDIGELCGHFLQHLAEQGRVGARILTPDGIRELERLELPGNVRQLHALLLRASYLADDNDPIDARHIREAARNGRKNIKPQAHHPLKQGGLKTALDSYEHEILLTAYHQHDGNRAKMAADLQIPLRTLADKIKKHQLERKKDAKKHDMEFGYSFGMAGSYP